MRPSWRTLLALWGPFKSHRFRRLQTWDRPRVLPHGKMRYNGLLPGDPANVKRPWLNG